jgi:hypothetical protein
MAPSRQALVLPDDYSGHAAKLLYCGKRIGIAFCFAFIGILKSVGNISIRNNSRDLANQQLEWSPLL